ncbi:MAG TPA: glycerol kinase GlpK [Nocardioidaceae bacterium]|nr:glycerol kinase GlpK [Nocardioidaceae bacterium]
MTQYVAALDQGTTSTRCQVFDAEARVVGAAQRVHRQLLPRPGWVELDPVEIWTAATDVLAGAVSDAGLTAADIAAVGVANQRETTVVWDRRTGEPVANAIGWQDTRTRAICDRLSALGGGADRYRDRVGLPLATYFAGPKLSWVLDHADARVRGQAESGDLVFGTVDSWLVWNLTGGTCGGVHITDVTNASRTMLMDLATLSWAPDICAEMGVPTPMLPAIASSSEVYGECRAGCLPGVPVAGILGDQQAALFGQGCFDPGTAKNTYGTGSFLLLNTGSRRVGSRHGLLTTVGHRLGGSPPTYALEGSVAVTGALVQWLRDNLGLIGSAAEVEPLAASVVDSGGVYLVPAFAGLFAPYWRPDARGALVGLTGFATRAHVARAALEATAFQTRDVLAAMEADVGVGLTELRVDGGMVVNDLLMQFQADLLGIPVVRPETTETTALGAAYAAGLATGYWPDLGALRANWREGRRWEPRMPQAERDERYATWQRAVERSLDWV